MSSLFKELSSENTKSVIIQIKKKIEFPKFLSFTIFEVGKLLTKSFNVCQTSAKIMHVTAIRHAADF